MVSNFLKLNQNFRPKIFSVPANTKRQILVQRLSSMRLSSQSINDVYFKECNPCKSFTRDVRAQMIVCMKRHSQIIHVYPNEFTGFPDTRLTRSLLLLMFLGAERHQKLRFSGKKIDNHNLNIIYQSAFVALKAEYRRITDLIGC